MQRKYGILTQHVKDDLTEELSESGEATILVLAYRLNCGFNTGYELSMLLLERPSFAPQLRNSGSGLPAAIQ